MESLQQVVQMEQVEKVAKRLMEKRLLLEDDVKLYVELARKRDIGLPSQ